MKDKINKIMPGNERIKRVIPIGKIAFIPSLAPVGEKNKNIVTNIKNTSRHDEIIPKPIPRLIQWKLG